MTKTIIRASVDNNWMVWEGLVEGWGEVLKDSQLLIIRHCDSFEQITGIAAPPIHCMQLYEESYLYITVSSHVEQAQCDVEQAILTYKLHSLKVNTVC